MFTVSASLLPRPASAHFASAFRRLLGFAAAFWSTVALAQFVWSPATPDGSGAWNIDTANSVWLNGAAQTSWTLMGGTATFSGSGGAVTVSTAVNVTGITFNTSGYSVVGASETASGLTVTSSTFPLHAAAPASIAVSALVGTGSTTLTKTGSARLALSTTLAGIPNIAVSSGELALSGTIFYNPTTHVALADVIDAILSFDESALTATFADLSGGGTSGGIVRPGGSSALTLTLVGSADTTFAGQLTDNPTTSASLFLYKLGSANQTLTGANTLSGATVVAGGRLTLAGNGSLLNSAVTVNAGATLALDNTGTLLANRLGDTRATLLAGGTLVLLGNGAAPTSETTGPLTVSAGQSRIEVSRTSGQAATLNFSSLTRLGAGAALEFAGDGTVHFSSASNTNGILGGYAVTGNHWAALDGSANVGAYSAYTSSLTTGATTDNVRLTAAPATAPTAAITRNSLALDTSTSDFELNLGASGNLLRLSSGGLLTTGSGTATISGGQLTTTNTTIRDLVAFARGNLTIESPVVDSTVTVGPVTTSFAVNLTKAGEGTLTLSGANSYTGDTRVLAGTLAISGGSAVPNSSTVTLSPGATLRLGGSTETIGGLAGSGTVQLENGQLTVAGNGLGGSAAIALGSGRLLSTSAQSTDFGGSLSGTGGLTQAGSGALTLSGTNSFTGALRVTSGSLLLLDDTLVIFSTPPAVELGGGTFGFNSNLVGVAAETLGPLTLTASSILQFHSSATLPTSLSFADSSLLTWNTSAQLRVTNYTSSRDVLRFGTGSTSLTTDQLSRIFFETADGLLPAQINNFGYVTPSAIPEPATTAVLTGAAALLVIVVRRRQTPRAS